MKLTFLVIILLQFSFQIRSQELNKRHLKKLNFLGIQTNKHDLNDLRTQIDFNEIIRQSRRKRINLGIATSISSTSSVPLMAGLSLLGIASLNKGNNTNGWVLPAGLITTAISLLVGSTSIPFYVMHSRNSKIRRTLLEKYKGNF